MNYIGHAFHFQQGDELFFQSPITRQPILPQQQQQQQQNQQQIIPGVIIGPSSSSINFQQGIRRKLASSSAPPAEDDGGQDDEKNSKKKKIIHRDVERQRRHEMAMLYASLRSLLPLEYLKGKRSISDHMNEAANYIKHQQKKIQELAEKRDGLRRVVSTTAACGSRGSGGGTTTDVVVRPSWTGVEVLLTCASMEVAPLSRVISMLMEAGLEVVSCLATNTHPLVVYNLQCEMMDKKEVDLRDLQQKLTDVVCPTPSSR